MSDEAPAPEAIANYGPTIHGLLEVRAGELPGEYFVLVDQTDAGGVREAIPFYLRRSDTFGMAPALLELVGRWTGDVLPALPPEAEPPPASIKRVKFYKGLLKRQVLNEQNAIAGIQGQVPATLMSVVNGLPAAQRFDATAMLSGEDAIPRGSPFIAVLAKALKWTDAQMDAFFRTSAEL